MEAMVSGMMAHTATNTAKNTRQILRIRWSRCPTSSLYPSPIMRLVSVLAVAANANTGTNMTMYALLTIPETATANSPVRSIITKKTNHAPKETSLWPIVGSDSFTMEPTNGIRTFLTGKMPYLRVGMRKRV